MYIGIIFDFFSFLFYFYLLTRIIYWIIIEKISFQSWNCKGCCMDDQNTYNSFLLQNRISVNRTLNKVLWFCLLVAPSIALGIFTGSFPNTTYKACFTVFISTALLAFIHTMMLRKRPDSVYTSHFIILSLDILLVLMSTFRINIHITWFFVPLLSILFCNTAFYMSTVVINYFFIIFSVYLMAPRYTLLRNDYETVLECFLNIMGGYTIETMAMAIAGYTVCKYITKYLKHIFDENATIRDAQQKMNTQLKIQESMAKIYDTVNLIDFDTMTEKALSDLDSQEYSVEGHAHSKMNHRIRKKVIKDQYDAFSEFTDITTIRERLAGKKSISEDFINVETGWFRAQYIPLDEDASLLPHKIIYTTQTIDDDKKKEEYLIHISTTDELTNLYNRRSYDQNMEKYNTQEIENDLVIISIDVNGLKKANDTKGHAAGDELIKGAADCIQLAISSIGKVFRTGGDEFLAAVNTDNPEKVISDISKNAGDWRGSLIDSLSLSIGYAAYKDYNNASISDLEKIADDKMYENKSEYYRISGNDRRVR